MRVMGNETGEDSSDDELETLLGRSCNRTVEQTITRKSLPQQRDLLGRVLPNQKPYYEEIHTKVSFGPTHHDLNTGNLGTYIYPTNYEVREYQFQIVKKALYENLICAIPTGTGKTFIASTVMLNFYRWTKNAKIIFTAPTRPLVAQQIKACLGVTGIPHDDTAILLDKSRKNRGDIWSSKRVFFTTPQVVENDLKRGVLNPKDVACLVIDEAHRARGAYSYVELSKFMDRFNTSYRILALTATPATDLEGVQEVVNNLNISRIELRTEEDADVARYMKVRDKEQVEVGLLPEIEDIIEQLGIAVTPVLKEAVELGIYDDCPPSQINAFVALQKSQKIIANPTIPEGVKWKNFFILQLLGNVGHMLRRLKIYGIRCFYTYFENKYKEFTTKYGMGKSTNKTAASFFYSPILKRMMESCQKLLQDPGFLGHEKLHRAREELIEFFQDCQPTSRVIIFTELRESALEIVKCIDMLGTSTLRPHIFIGQARGKEGFDDGEYAMKHKPKGRKKADRLKRLEQEQLLEEEKKKEKERKRLDRAASRTGTSEEAQVSGMNQKQQKEVLRKFKDGTYNILVCTSIGEEGLDIGEVDLIICYDATSSPIKNIQRMGRTGRKRDGKIVLLLSGNESKKFAQAMEDYSELQRIVSRDTLEYRQSDRIIPKEIEPVCEKKFIMIGEEGDELNNIDDSDDVIRFATQAMLGKLKSKKDKKPKKGKAGKREKQAGKTFFMPDNVDAGIVSASTMVNKFSIDSAGNKVEVLKKEPQTDLRFPVLDDIALDSSESSPVKSEVGLSSQQLSSMQVSSLLTRYKNTADTDITSGFPESPPSLQKRPLESTTPASSSDEGLPPVKAAKTRLPSFSDEGAYDSQIPLTAKSQESAVDAEERVHKNRFNKLDGLLSSQERRYFEENYSALCGVCIEPTPHFHEHTRIGLVPHSDKADRLIRTFQNMNANTKDSIADMSRHKAYASRLEQAAGKDIRETTSLGSPSIIVQDDEIQHVIEKPRDSSDVPKVSQNRYPGADADLADLLDSDFSDI